MYIRTYPTSNAIIIDMINFSYLLSFIINWNYYIALELCFTNSLIRTISNTKTKIITIIINHFKLPFSSISVCYSHVLMHSPSLGQLLIFPHFSESILTVIISPLFSLYNYTIWTCKHCRSKNKLFNNINWNY